MRKSLATWVAHLGAGPSTSATCVGSGRHGKNGQSPRHLGSADQKDFGVPARPVSMATIKKATSRAGARACNPSFSGGPDQEDRGLRPA
jgi:hypothetical protein